MSRSPVTMRISVTGSSVLNSNDSIAVEDVSQILDFGLQSIKAVTKARWT